MTRKLLTRLISILLQERFELQDLFAIRKLLQSGALMDVFPRALDEAIKGKEAHAKSKET